MKMVMGPKPAQLPSHVRVLATTASAFNPKTYMAFGYKSFEAVLVGPGGNGGNGGNRKASTYGGTVPGKTYYSSGGTGGGGTSGGQVTDSGLLSELTPLTPVTVGTAPGIATTFNGQSAGGGVSGSNGGHATATAGGSGGARGTPAPLGGNLGVAGQPGGSWTSNGLWTGPLDYVPATGGEGYLDPVTDITNGEGGRGGQGANISLATAGAGQPGQAGVVILDFQF